MAVHLLLAGYFGSGNLGDDAMMLGFVHSLGEGFDITVLSGSPEETFRNYGFRSIPKMDMREVDKAIKQCDALVFPGGSIFQDVTSLRSVAYYSQLVKKAKNAGKRVFLLGQGVGPLNRFLGKRMAANAFNAADVIAVRDPGSAVSLKNLGVKGNIRLTADPAFLLPPAPDDGAQNFTVGNMTTVGISPRPFGKDKKALYRLFGDLCSLLFKANMMPVLIEMDRTEDGPLIAEIGKMQGGKIPDIRKLQTPMQVQARMARMDAVIAMRLHGGILAATVGVPPFMISYDPKVAAFAKMMDVGSVAFEGLTAQRLFEQFMEFHRNRERNVKNLIKRRDELTQLARQNIDIIRDSLAMPIKT